MKRKHLAGIFGLSIILLSAFSFKAQTADPQLLAEIKQIRAIDNHSHVERVLTEGETDTEGDAISCGGLEFVSPPPMRLRPDNPIYIGAWRELFGYRYDDMSETHVRELLSVKRKMMREKSDAYPAWILDKLNIEVMLANRISMGRGLKAPRFRWVSYGDPLLLPFSTQKMRQVNSDVKFFYEQEEKLFKRFLADLKIGKLPTTFNQYLKTIVTPTLERQKAEGAVAIKFVPAYYRTLDFAEASEAEARTVYTRYAGGGEPSATEYKKFQDYVFRYVLREAGRLGLVVHIHTGGGCGHFFHLRGSNPLLLEPIFNDPAFRKTNFVLVHGGYPFTNETAFLVEKPNVYADFSAQTFLLSPRTLSRVLRNWLEYEPEKILFGTDASPATPEVGWEESAWLTSNTAREALALALTEMITDGEITRARASELARMVLRENAAALYKISP
jgi:uncharacterized protein